VSPQISLLVLYSVVLAVLSVLMWIKLENENFYRNSSHELYFELLKTFESDEKRCKLTSSGVRRTETLFSFTQLQLSSLRCVYVFVMVGHADYEVISMVW
jgi:hypothetical protein